MSLIPAKKKSPVEGPSVLKTRGKGIDSRLGEALKRSGEVLKANRTVMLHLPQVLPNPRNKRVLVIPLEEMLTALGIGTDNPLVYVDTKGDLKFPELDELPGLGCEAALSWTSVRQKSFYKKIKGLARSIQFHKGLLQPLEVFPHDELKMLNIGHRRWYAAHFTDIATLEALIKEKVNSSPLQSALRRWDENDKRDDLCLYERISEVKEIVELLHRENGKRPKQVDVANYLSLSKPEMSFFMRILKAELTEAEYSLILEHDLNDLRTVSEICRLDEVSLRDKAFSIYLHRGNSVARDFVADQLNNKSGEEKPVIAKQPRVSIKPTQTSMKELMGLLRGVRPELVENIEESASPKEILSCILTRLEELAEEQVES